MVRVANEGRNSRYYSGSGIYRHVHLTVVDAVHVPLWGVSVVRAWRLLSSLLLICLTMRLLLCNAGHAKGQPHGF
eukprot:SAG11_NODE_7941_length_1079_cov_1.098980_3_plen_75_part_00